MPDWLYNAIIGLCCLANLGACALHLRWLAWDSRESQRRRYEAFTLGRRLGSSEREITWWQRIASATWGEDVAREPAQEALAEEERMLKHNHREAVRAGYGSMLPVTPVTAHRAGNARDVS